MTTNEDFVVVIGSDSSVSHGHAKVVHVGDNLAGHELIEGTGRVIEGVEFCIHHTSTDNLYSPYKYSRCFLFSELNLTSGIAPYVGSSPMFYGHFGTVSNNGSSTSSDASTFSIEVTFLVKNINANTNGKTITLTSKIYHSPSIRNYVSNLNFKVKHFTIGLVGLVCVLNICITVSLNYIKAPFLPLHCACFSTHPIYLLGRWQRRLPLVFNNQNHMTSLKNTGWL